MGGAGSRCTTRPNPAPSVNLTTLVYVSRMVAKYFSDPRNVKALVRFSAANNEEKGITGYLLVAVPFFLQRLEGPAEKLHTLLRVISRDHRHTDVVVVEERPIERRTCPDWGMKSFDAVAHAGDKFDAVAFMLQALSSALQVAARTLHPTLFRQLLDGTPPGPENVTAPCVVVTLVLGPTLLSVDSGHSLLADPGALFQITEHLYQRLCPLNPGGRVPITLFGGTALQVLLDCPITAPGLANKVVRACVELVSGQGPFQCQDVKMSVWCGDAQVFYLSRAEYTRKGRYVAGPPLAAGLAVAQRLTQDHREATLVVAPAVAAALKVEFQTDPLVVTGYPVQAIRVYASNDNRVCALAPLKGLSTSCEAAVSVLLKSAKALEQDKQPCPTEAPPASVPKSPSLPDLPAGLEWIYGIDPEAEGKAEAGARPRLRGLHGKAQRQKIVRLDPASRLRQSPNHPTAFLNVVYLSMIPAGKPMTHQQLESLGRQSGHDNAARGVTGFLLCTRPFFLQCMEGPTPRVEEVFLKIYRDPRHQAVTVLAFRHIRTRMFGAWPMRTLDLDAEAGQDSGPLREVLHLLARHYTALHQWLTRPHHDVLLSWVPLRSKAHAQCALVAFAAIHRSGTFDADRASLMLHTLSGFLSLGGEILGFLGAHLVGYTFVATQDTLLDEVVDLCENGDIHIGVATGRMLLLNVGDENCELALFGPIFDRARALADRAVTMRAHVLAEEACQVEVAGLAWEPQTGGLSVGHLELGVAAAARPEAPSPPGAAWS